MHQRDICHLTTGRRPSAQGVVRKEEAGIWSLWGSATDVGVIKLGNLKKVEMAKC